MSVNASDSLVFLVKVMPSSGRQAWQLDKSGILKCYLKSAPERGKANAELIKFIAKSLKITSNQVDVLAGGTSRNKKIKVVIALSYDQLLESLGIQIQKNIFL